MKKQLAILLCGAILASTAACASGDSSGEKSGGDKVKISMISHIYKPWNDKLDEQIKAFEKENPNISVEYSMVEHADLNTKLMTSLSANSAPNVMGVYGPWMADLVQNEWLDAAPDYVVEDIEQNTFDFAGESAKYGDQYFGYIQHLGIATPVINTELYDAAGVTPPTTYEELLEVNEKLDIYEGDQLVQAGSVYPATRDGSWNVIAWSTILQSYGGSIMNEDNTATAFNTPEGLEATEVYAQLTHPKFVKDSFSLGKSAMEYVGPFQRSFYEENCPNIKYQALEPLAGPADTVSALYVWFWTVAADATDAQREASWKLLNYLSNDENYLDMANTAGFISFRTKNYEDESYANDEWIKAYQEALNTGKIYYSKIPNWEKIDLVLGTELEKLVIGEQTAQETLDNMEAGVQELLN